MRRRLAVAPGFVPRLDPADALDPHVALPARRDKPDRAALFGAERLAAKVLMIFRGMTLPSLSSRWPLSIGWRIGGLTTPSPAEALEGTLREALRPP